jgi:hypothetical protein
MYMRKLTAEGLEAPRLTIFISLAGGRGSFLLFVASTEVVGAWVVQGWGWRGAAEAKTEYRRKTEHGSLCSSDLP